jgi:hypothetical protein
MTILKFLFTLSFVYLIEHINHFMSTYPMIGSGPGILG